MIRQLQCGNVPDVVVFYDGFNDVWAGFQQNEAGLPLNEVNRRKEFNLLNATQTSFPAVVLFHHALPAITRLQETGLFRPRRVPKFKERADLADLSERVVDAYANNLRVVEALGEEYGFKTVFYWHPTIYNKKSLTDYERRQKEIIARLESILVAAYANIDEAAELRENTSFHNISGIFADIKDALFIDGVHVAERGNRIVAETMSEDVAAVLAEGS